VILGTRFSFDDSHSINTNNDDDTPREGEREPGNERARDLWRTESSKPQRQREPKQALWTPEMLDTCRIEQHHSSFVGHLDLPKSPLARSLSIIRS